MRIGYFLASEEFTPAELLAQAQAAERAGFDALWISDHYTRPDQPPPIYVSGFGGKSTTLAGRIGDGFITTAPDADALARFREAGGAGKPTQAAFKAAYAETEDEGARIANQRWPNSGLPGELAQLLPTPQHFAQASTLVTQEMLRSRIVCGNDPEPHLKKLAQYADAGFDEVYVANIGPHQDGFFSLYADRVLPRLR